ncbi:hypothetical protein LTR64_005450 [Lithohypha guttulata]|uniref:uncharacterized protein n=1 Tax=Lithohypha guttulata TaxID=1690604 RepID=UPI002DDE378E|nr:hypothetical protein LTR51_002757 [Lithohypha guttulata]
MSNEETQPPRQKAIIGNLNHDFWIYDSETGFDLTRPPPPFTNPRHSAITIRTTSSPITITPSKTALVIIDMQNFFLSEALGRPAGSKGLKAQEHLLRYAVPAARKAGVQVVWLNWGLREEDLERMPPATVRAFGFGVVGVEEFERMVVGNEVDSDNGRGSSGGGVLNRDLGKDARIYKGLGQDLGTVTLLDGTAISAGRMLMADQWNAQLSPPLHESYTSSLETSLPDMIIDKNRISGMHLPASPASLYFQEKDIKTLIFAGVNTDQCVLGTLADAYCQGYDVVMLRDGCATTSPVGAQECVENNVAKTMGFLIDCQWFADGVEESLAGKET